MKFTAAAIFGAIMAMTASAKLNYGIAQYDDGHADHAIWVDGENLCNYVFLGSNSDNPCFYNNGYFTLDGTSYRLTGCGGNEFCILNADGNVNSCAVGDQGAAVSCPANSFGAFTVQEQFHFGN
jgi:hypothetical protein